MPGYARTCSNIQGYAESSADEEEDDEELPCECILLSSDRCWRSGSRGSALFEVFKTLDKLEVNLIDRRAVCSADISFRTRKSCQSQVSTLSSNGVAREWQLCISQGLCLFLFL